MIMKTIKMLILAAGIAGLLCQGAAQAADSPVGTWKTVDDKTGKIMSDVEFYEQDGKLFGKITGLTEPVDDEGQPKICAECKGDDKNKPVVGLVIVQNLVPSGGRYKGGTILDPEDGKVYKAEIWIQDGKLRVRGYLGIFFKTQTWIKAG